MPRIGPCFPLFYSSIIMRNSMWSFLKKIYIKFTSRKTTIYLITILSFFYFLGLVIPQRSIVAPEKFAGWQVNNPALVQWLISLRFTNIYSSPVVAFFTALFFLNLVLVTIKRIPAVIGEIRTPGIVDISPDRISAFPIKEKLAVDGKEDVEHIKDKLRALGYRIVSGCFKGVKNSFSIIGSLFFHVSFIFFLAGGLLIFHTRFWGETFVTEGQFFSGKRPDYRTVVRLSELRKTMPDLSFVVDKISPKFDRMEPVSLKTHITAEKNGERKSGSFDVNYPFRMGSTSILITDVGVAPYLQVTDSHGREMFGAYVMLNILRGDEDHFTLRETDHDIRVKLWPDYAVDEKGNRTTRSYYLNNPYFAVTIRKGARTAAVGPITSPSDAVSFDGKKLFIRDIRYYGRFVITDEKGGEVLIGGFILSLIGLMLRFIRARREVYGAWEVRGGRMTLVFGYRVEYFGGIGKTEFEKLAARLR